MKGFFAALNGISKASTGQPVQCVQLELTEDHDSKMQAAYVFFAGTCFVLVLPLLYHVEFVRAFAQRLLDTVQFLYGSLGNHLSAV